MTRDSGDDIWDKSSAEMETMRKARSASLSDVLDGGVMSQVKPVKPTRQHWEKGGMRQRCNGCRRQIHLVFRRHHCRRCGKIFCHDCSRFKRRLSDDARPHPEGNLQRVCLYCVQDDDEPGVGFTKSWTTDFANMRMAAHARKCPRRNGTDLKLLCEIPQICQPVIEIFLSEITKGKQNVVKTKIDNVVKAARRKTACSSCTQPLLVPNDRKECVVCEDIFCKKCSSKNIVVYYPHDTVIADEAQDGRVQPNLDIMNTSTDMSTVASMWRNYRVCCPCEENLGRVLKLFHFDIRLQDSHYELQDLGSQLEVTLSRALTLNFHENQLTSSMEDLNKMGSDFRHQRSQSDAGFLYVFPSEESKLAEERVTQKMFDRYFAIYNFIRLLKPVTQTQAKLHRNILSATTKFYSDQRWHFRIRYDSNASSTSEGE